MLRKKYTTIILVAIVLVDIILISCLNKKYDLGEIFKYIQRDKLHKNVTKLFHFSNQSINQSSRFIFSNVNLVCIILSSFKSYEERVSAVYSSWAHRCNKTLIACNNCRNATLKNEGNTKKITNISFLELPIIENYNRMAFKVMLIVKTVYENYGSQFNWFFLSDDDTFVFTRNLYKFIQIKDTNEPFTYGYDFKVIVAGGYHSGGAGVLFTHESIKRLHDKIKNNGCNHTEGFGDIALGLCSEEAGVKLGNSLDSKGRERFHPFNPRSHYFSINSGLLGYAKNEVKLGDDCCSDETISFHYVTPELMYNLAFFNKLN